MPAGACARFYLVPCGATLESAGDGSVTLPADAVVGEEMLIVGDITLVRLPSALFFWFAWYGNFPETTWWPEPVVNCQF